MIVNGDEDRLRQVIGNLLTNVRVHTPTDTPVEVSLMARDGVASLNVADQGPGVDPDHVEHIFDRFYRADTGRSRDRGGAGLGLSIAASVALAHGARSLLDHPAAANFTRPSLPACPRRPGRWYTRTTRSADVTSRAGVTLAMDRLRAGEQGRVSLARLPFELCPLQGPSCRRASRR